MLPLARLAHRHVTSSSHGQQPLHGRRVEVAAMPQRPDVKLLDDVHQPAAMVGVGVGQHHQVEVAPARASQPPHGGGVGPTVNEDRRAG